MYALASGLIGFASDSLRVRVVRLSDLYAWVVTADLSSAGVPLTLDRSQVDLGYFDRPAELPVHREGLVVFG